MGLIKPWHKKNWTNKKNINNNAIKYIKWRQEYKEWIYWI
ncbi:hypothetical protein BSPWISOXPB_7346 [uncultured Gammaproteobacteria bacterium]|nr:hypothetical protein BSPWISOXPB_7346 [uncultured Gammaproteobacteria bacterium]